MTIRYAYRKLGLRKKTEMGKSDGANLELYMLKQFKFKFANNVQI